MSIVDIAQPEHVVACPSCGSTHSTTVLCCPKCHRLTRAESLKRLAEEAQLARTEGRDSEELGAWRTALELLPPESTQYKTIEARVLELSRALDANPGGPATKTNAPKWLATLGAVGLLLWKLKFVAVFILTKGKLLLLGLTKPATLFSMLMAMGVYWAVFGWQFAAGLIVSIYIHEMGHVAALTRFGIKASAPMFIPGIGAVIRSHQYPSEPREDARVGLAGPIFGLGAAFTAYMIHLGTGWESLAAIASFGALINLLNLIPIPPLDGGRGMRALARWQRVCIAIAFGLAAYWSGESLILVLALVACTRCFQPGAQEKGDTRSFIEFVGLIASLTVLAMIEVKV